jgi:hypothetical protein
VTEHREVLDSYTGDPYEEPYVSDIDGIEKGRSPFYKEAELKRISEQYTVGPAAEGYYLHRRGCPRTLFPGLPTQEQAIRAMDWCVLNDGSVGVAIHWLAKGDVGPFLTLLDYFMEAANGPRQQEASAD